MSKVKQIRGLVGLAASISGLAGAAAGIRAAKDKRDALLVVNAAASALAAITGVLLAIRKLREDEEL
jgi:hypothetical protein